MNLVIHICLVVVILVSSASLSNGFTIQIDYKLLGATPASPDSSSSTTTSHSALVDLFNKIARVNATAIISPENSNHASDQNSLDRHAKQRGIHIDSVLVASSNQTIDLQASNIVVDSQDDLIKRLLELTPLMIVDNLSNLSSLSSIMTLPTTTSTTTTTTIATTITTSTTTTPIITTSTMASTGTTTTVDTTMTMTTTETITLPIVSVGSSNSTKSHKLSKQFFRLDWNDWNQEEDTLNEMMSTAVMPTTEAMMSTVMDEVTATLHTDSSEETSLATGGETTEAHTTEHQQLPEDKNKTDQNGNHFNNNNNNENNNNQDDYDDMDGFFNSDNKPSSTTKTTTTTTTKTSRRTSLLTSTTTSSKKPQQTTSSRKISTTTTTSRWGTKNTSTTTTSTTPSKRLTTTTTSTSRSTPKRYNQTTTTTTTRRINSTSGSASSRKPLTTTSMTTTSSWSWGSTRSSSTWSYSSLTTTSSKRGVTTTGTSTRPNQQHVTTQRTARMTNKTTTTSWRSTRVNNVTATTTTRRTTSSFPKIKCPSVFKTYCVNSGECYFKSRTDLELGDDPLCDCSKLTAVVAYGLLERAFSGLRCELVVYSFTQLGYAIALSLCVLIVCLMATLCAFICGACRKDDDDASRPGNRGANNKPLRRSSLEEKSLEAAGGGTQSNDSWRFVRTEPGNKHGNEFYFKRLRGSSNGRRTVQKYIEKHTRNILKSIEGLMSTGGGSSSLSAAAAAAAAENGNHGAVRRAPFDLNDNFIFVNRCFRNDDDDHDNDVNGGRDGDGGAHMGGVYPKPMRSSNPDHNVFNSRCGQHEQTALNGSLYY